MNILVSVQQDLISQPLDLEIPDITTRPGTYIPTPSSFVYVFYSFMVHSRPLFLYFRLFFKQLTEFNVQ